MYTYRTGENFDTETFPEEESGDKTTWHYDEATGHLIAKEDDKGNKVRYTYTVGGKLKTRTWARLVNGEPLITSYSYDDKTGELIKIDYSDLTHDIIFRYNRLGQKIEITDAHGTRTFAYDKFFQPDKEFMKGLVNRTIDREFDSYGRPTGIAIGDGSVYQLTYAYDPVTARFESIKYRLQDMERTTKYTYLPGSDLLHQKISNSGTVKNFVTTYIYEPHRNHKTSVINSVGGEIISQYDYVYDAGGRRTSVKNSGKAFEQEKFNKYGYNDRSELTESSSYVGTDLANMSKPITSEYRSYQYDNIGNREKAIDWDETDKDLRTTYYESNSLNQYEQTNDGKDQSNFVYDADGNMTSVISSNGDVMMYTYNCENRLIAAGPANPNEGDLKGEYLYDYMGRRIRKKVYEFNSMEWKLKETRLFVWDGWNMIEEVVQVVAEDEFSKYYVWGLDLSQSLDGAGGVGGLIVCGVLDNSKVCNYFYDGNGNVLQVIDYNNTFIDINEYDPYGNSLTSLTDEKISSNPFSLSTKYQDYELKLIYYGYRYYYQNYGRWIRKDIIDEKYSLNLYSYIHNNTINLFDLLGLSAADVDKIYNTFKMTIDKWTKEGKRNMAPFINNPYRFFYDITHGFIGAPYYGCGEQWLFMTEEFRKNTYNDIWTFEYQEDTSELIFTKLTIWRHQYGKAISNNPYDPIIIYDPWKDLFKLIYEYKYKKNNYCEGKRR